MVFKASPEGHMTILYILRCPATEKAHLPGVAIENGKRRVTVSEYLELEIMYDK